MIFGNGRPNAKAERTTDQKRDRYFQHVPQRLLGADRLVIGEWIAWICLRATPTRRPACPYKST
jgi:hypothetical protein